MVNRDFDQAGALIKRLMEGVGGSADAYEEPIVGPVREEPASRAPEPPVDDEDTTVSFGEDIGICVDGEVELPEDRSWWTNPPPITDEYEPFDVVEAAEELKAIYEAIVNSLETDEPQPVQLETGQVMTERQHGRTWVVKDTVKDRLYCQENSGGMYDVVDEDDTFIWVMQISDHDVDLGYIHEGYVFLHK